MTLTIGLTGSIASGKSTVANMFKALSIPVVDADKIAREVVLPGEDAYVEVVKAFGNEILLADKQIDRKKLGSIIFADEAKRQTLNNIIHPAIRKRMVFLREQHFQNGNECVVLDIPLLFESKLTHFVDKILVVYVTEEVQLKRLMDRDQIKKKEAEQRINAQISIEEKVKLADRFIDNSFTKEYAKGQLESILKDWQVIE